MIMIILMIILVVGIHNCAGQSTSAPTTEPTFAPTPVPSAAPTVSPTVSPTAAPTVSPTAAPTVSPTLFPTVSPTAAPTVSPTLFPTVSPTVSPTISPTPFPTSIPTSFPTSIPTSSPTSFIFNIGGSNERHINEILISTGLVTIIFVGFTLLLLVFDKSHRKFTRLFAILQNLLISGLIIAFNSIANVIASAAIGEKNIIGAYVFCFFAFQTRHFFYYASFVWNSLLAIYFLQNTLRSYETSWIHRELSIRRRTVNFLFKVYEYPTHIFWLVPIILLIPSLLYNIISFARVGKEYTSENFTENFSYSALRVPDYQSELNEIICSANTTTIHGRIMDIFIFETVLFLTLLFNIIVYTYSMYKIKMKSPDSVVQRAMKKTSGYLLVQIIVWLPLFISNIYSISQKSPTKSALSGVLWQVALNNLQGFLNCVIYIYTDRLFRKWMGGVLESMKEKGRNNKTSTTDRAMSNSTDLELSQTPRSTFLEGGENEDDNIVERNTFKNNSVKSILTVKSALHKSKKDNDINFGVSKFVKFKAEPDVRFIGGEPNRVTETNAVTIRIGNELSLEEKNS